jgi:hypothetical protein
MAGFYVFWVQGAAVTPPCCYKDPAAPKRPSKVGFSDKFYGRSEFSFFMTVGVKPKSWKTLRNHIFIIQVMDIFN